jgi:hypothetical protein
MTVEHTDRALDWLDAYEKAEQEANDKLKSAR